MSLSLMSAVFCLIGAGVPAKASADKPGAMAGHAMVYSSKAGRVLLFEGESTERTPVWRLRGATWDRLPGTEFVPRSLPAMASDPESGLILLHGGAVGTRQANGQIDWKPSAETLTFDGKAWKTVATTGPRPRDHHAMIFDSRRNKFVLYGGSDADPSGRSEYFGDTWEGDGKGWSRVAVDGPPARCHHAMAYDPVRGQTVLVGGYGPNGPDGKTWIWDGKSWSVAAQGGPGWLSGCRMAFDEALGKLVLVGGDTREGLSTKTWGWDGKSWSVLSEGGPPGRTVHALAYDPENKRLVLFGGATPDPVGDLWEFKEGKWHKLG